MAPAKRIIIADDHDMVRRGLRDLLEPRPNLRIVGEASTGREALRIAIDTSPDIAIVDYSLPEMNGHDLTLELKRRVPCTQVLIYTLHDREDIILDLLRAGARGFVHKCNSEKHLFAALDALSLNQPYFSDAISDALLGHYLNSKPQATSGSLSLREREVVQLICEGKINKQVAELLNISLKTVETHRAAAMHKLKLRSTADLVRYALRNNLVEP